ncbi:MAG: DUF192 domain-containing protein [Nanoarchaeota archaeon]|nr:DUF192 domain-containing protein [Nanoarchaeota archaeon]
MKKILFALLLLAVACSSPYVKMEDKKIHVEIADEYSEMTTGLMNRDNLCDNCGMLFVFPEEMAQNFWMKNTLIPLDMVFIDADFKIVDVLKADPCSEDPCKQYIPQANAKYVLEVNRDTFNTDDIGKKFIFNI